MKSTVRIGTRGSALALYQAEYVKGRILKEFAVTAVEIVKIKTGGDMVRRGGLSPVETKRLYTKEIEETLLTGEIDLAVHSAKDMSVVLPEGLEIGAVTEREDVRDCLVNKDGKKLAELPFGARIGTSSLRRKVQLLRWYPELIIEEARGNVDTRIRKVEEGLYDATVLAYAGIKRLGFSQYVTEVFSEEKFYPAPGQGAIAVECRAGDDEIRCVLRPIHHRPSGIRLSCERAFLKRLGGGCQLPCGITTVLDKDQIRVSGGIFDPEGHRAAEDLFEGPAERAESVGEMFAERILEKGGNEILRRIRKEYGKRK